MTAARQLGGRSYDARMFDRRDNQPVTWRSAQTEQSQVIRLAATAGEDEPIGTRSVEPQTQDRGDRLAGIVQRLPRSAAGGVLARRVGRELLLTRPHRLRDARIERSGRVEIEVNLGHSRSADCGKCEGGQTAVGTES